MSRCFPFPPPGYEKKITIDDTDLLKEEKHKEKKHKDKEKRDRDKDRSREKHKEKKERKEKRERNEKDRERDKQQDKISNEKRIGEHGCSSAENLSSKCMQNNGITDNKYVQELARRIVDADTTAGSQMVQNTEPAKKRKAKQLAKPAENNNGNHTEEGGKPKVKIGDGRRVNGCTDHFEASCMENAIGENFFGMDWKRVDGISLSNENQLDGQEKKKNKESGKSDRQKDRHQEKSRMPMDNNWEKENKKEEKAKEVNTQSNNGHLKLKECSVRLKESDKDAVDSSNFKPPSMLKTSSKSSAGVRNVGKGKDLELNRLLPENGSGPNKFLRPISSHSVIENGKKLEPCKTAFQPTSKKQGPFHSQRVDVKEHGINSVVKDQGQACSTTSSSSVLAVHSSGDTSAKPPHPDSKYLSQILAVPKVELSDFDDQEWLFSSDNLLSKKPKVACNLVDRTAQVWADALKIDSADVTALPYVIPY